MTTRLVVDLGCTCLVEFGMLAMSLSSGLLGLVGNGGNAEPEPVDKTVMSTCWRRLSLSHSVGEAKRLTRWPRATDISEERHTSSIGSAGQDARGQPGY